jgi:hypothetical protein
VPETVLLMWVAVAAVCVRKIARQTADPRMKFVKTFAAEQRRCVVLF